MGKLQRAKESSANSSQNGRGRGRRLSPSLALSMVALFISLGGVGYAAATGSIDSREIKNNTIRGKDIRSGTLASSDVKNNSLTGTDVVESSLGTVPSAGSAGTAGVAGSAGRAGNADALGGVPAGSYPSGVEIVTAESPVETADPAAYGAATATANCPTGKRVIGGGGSTNFANLAFGVLNAVIQDSGPNTTHTGWRVTSIESGGVAEEGQPWQVIAHAICATR